LSTIDLVIDALATYRLTRLATVDAIGEPLRQSIVRRALGTDVDGAGDEGPSAQELVEDHSDPPRIATLVTCRWCASVWIAVGVVGARRWMPSWGDPAARAFALSAVAVLVAGLEDN
jgi:hypothetical protein